MNHDGDFAVRQFLSLLSPCCVDNALVAMVRISSHYRAFLKISSANGGGSSRYEIAPGC